MFKDKTIFITGHTGFIGSWLSLWLHTLGANVIGYALEPNITPSLFKTLNLKDNIVSIIGDVRDMDHLQSCMSEHKPEFVIHLAAQPIVLLSYLEPLQTIQTNVMGTANLLETVKNTSSVKICINFTSDKCYENRGYDYAYREDDPLGGIDPYSASKAASELISASYRKSFFKNPDKDHFVSISTVRAGNVIGGGDWSENRIVSDTIRSLMAGKDVLVRNPDATRPWQHVFEPISGMLWLMTHMWLHPDKFNEPWNFGPNNSSIKVRDLVNQIIKEWGYGFLNDISKQNKDSPHEASFLKLDCTKANKLLGWHSVFDIKNAISETVKWYKAYTQHKDEVNDFSIFQIEDYIVKAKQMNIPWANSEL